MELFLDRCPKCKIRMLNVPLGVVEKQGFWSIKRWSVFQWTCYKCGHKEKETKVKH